MISEQKIYVIDAHCDTLYEMLTRGGTLENNDFCLSFDRLLSFGGYIQFFAAWIEDGEQEPFQKTMAMIELLNRELLAHSDKMIAIKQWSDFQTAFDKHKVGAMLTVENGLALEGNIDNLYRLYDAGVRALTLTWNDRNQLADGVFCESAGGLTDFGRQVVKIMNCLGMMVDVSHLSEQGFWEVLEISSSPVMASHSNARAMCNHCRNLSDSQIRAMAETGGMIGLNLYPIFLNERGSADLTDCIRHIDHMVSLGAENSLGLGSDFDGFSGLPTSGIAHPGDYGNLFHALITQGYGETFIKKLSCENYFNYTKKILM